VAAGASYTSMKEALKHQYSGKEMTIKQVFDTLDEASAARPAAAHPMRIPTAAVTYCCRL